jgi:hypothetical protein
MAPSVVSRIVKLRVVIINYILMIDTSEEYVTRNNNILQKISVYTLDR